MHFATAQWFSATSTRSTGFPLDRVGVNCPPHLGRQHRGANQFLRSILFQRTRDRSAHFTEQLRTAVLPWATPSALSPIHRLAAIATGQVHRWWEQGNAWKRKNPRADLRLPEGFLKTGDTYFRTGMHYHRLGKLNYCVRDGNRWIPPAIATGLFEKAKALKTSQKRKQTI